MARSTPSIVHARDLADLPFAAALTAYRGQLEPGEEYDAAHVDHVSFDDPDAAGSIFLECALTNVSIQRGQFRRARFTDVWLQDVCMIGTSLVQTTWMDAAVSNGVAAGVEAFGSRLRRVVVRGCKLDTVNFRDAALIDVTFDRCVLRDVDFSGAALTRTSFPHCRMTGTDFTRAALDTVDLRGAELGITVDPASLRGAIVTPAQLADLAPLLADSLGIVVTDPPASHG